MITLANFGQGMLDYVICREENLKNPNGPYKFRFHKCGKWHTVTVDNIMPMCGTARSAYYSMIKAWVVDIIQKVFKQQWSLQMRNHFLNRSNKELLNQLLRSWSIFVLPLINGNGN